MIKEFKEGLKEFSLNFNALINLTILTLVYFLGIGLSALVAKILHKEFLDLKISHRKKSYWVKLDAPSAKISDYLRQY